MQVRGTRRPGYFLRTIHTQFTERFQHFFAAVQCYAMNAMPLCLLYIISICVFWAPQSVFNLVHSHHERVQILLLMNVDDV